MDWNQGGSEIQTKVICKNLGLKPEAPQEGMQVMQSK